MAGAFAGFYPKCLGRSGVYALTFKGVDVYLGSSKRCVLNRMQVHISSLKKGTHKSVRVQALWNKNNEALFGFRVIEFCLADTARSREAYWGQRINTLLNTWIEGTPRPVSRQQRKRASAATKEFWSNPAWKAAQRKKLSIGSKRRWSKTSERQKQSEAQRKRFRLEVSK